MEIETVGQLQVYLLLKKADLLEYFTKLISIGGDNLMQLSSISDDELVDIFGEIGMIDKPVHVLRFQKTLNEWNTNPQIFVDEIDNYDFCVNTMKIEKNFRKDFDNRIKQLCEDFCDQADERLTDEEKRKIQLERTSLAAEYGNDFESIQKYCIEKIIKRNLNIKSTIIDEEILLQISLQLCQIDHTFLKNYNRLISAATKVKEQFKESFREIEDQSD